MRTPNFKANLPTTQSLLNDWRLLVVELLLAVILSMPFWTWQPLFVVTASVPRGIYLLHTADKTFQRGDYVVFDYQDPAWAVGRGYASKHEVFTKQALGLPGDVVRTDGHVLKVCSPEGVCLDGGQIRPFDSAGRPVPAYANQDYQLPGDALYAGATFNPKSFDSRYYGPVSLVHVRGKAFPLWTE